ncbi:MAG TPA: hypothetical protein DEP45_15275 [Armatimonadetes bacterium]|nr:hypothetical protein [Armatimonadota bacterium]
MSELLLDWIRAYGEVGVFAFLALENIGIPWPTALAFLVTVELVRQGEMSFATAVLLCTAAHVAGSGVSYALGRAGDNALMARLRQGSGLRHALEWLDRWYARHGDATVFGARLIGQVRPWASFAAGSGEVRVWPFVAWTAVGSAIHSVIALKLTEVGFVVWDVYPRLRIVIIVVGALLFWSALVWGAWKCLRERRLARAQAKADLNLTA